MTRDQQQLLDCYFGDVGKKLFADQVQNAKKKSKYAYRYSNETKQFAVTLHYYSPRAYNFVRRILKLPHQAKIREWNASVDCEPGFLTNVITSLGEMAKSNKAMRDVVLTIDAMAI